MARNTIGVLISAALLLTTLSGGALAQSDMATAQKNLRKATSEARNAEAKRKEILKELARLGKKSTSVENKIKIKKLEYRKSVQEVRIQKAKVQKSKAEVNGVNGDISNSSKEIRSSRNHLAKRARALMKLTMLNNVEYLMKSSDSAELELRIKMLNKVADADATLIEKTLSQKKELETLKSSKEMRLALLQKEEKRLRYKEDAVRRAKRALERTQRLLQKQTKANKKALEQTKKLIASTKKAIRDANLLIKKIQGAGLKAPIAKPISGASITQPIPGMKSVYLKAPFGTPVKSISKGTVASVTPYLRGVGRSVIIGHGKNYSTVYANLSSANVKKGQKVKYGTVIGKSGKTPDGDMMLFAVYKDGKPLDTKRMFRK